MKTIKEIRLDSARITYLERFDECKRKIDLVEAYRPFLNKKEQKWLSTTHAEILNSKDNHYMNRLVGAAIALLGKALDELRADGLTLKAAGAVIGVSATRADQLLKRYSRVMKHPKVRVQQGYDTILPWL